MVRNRCIHLIIYCLLCSPAVFAKKIDLPVLAAKQSPHTVRLITKDGKLSFYQRATGSLFMSTNYDIFEILKSKKHTNYLLYSSPARKKIIIEQNENFHNYYGIRKLKNIYQLDWGKTKPKMLGKGLNPVLHLDDSWCSFFDPYTNTIHIKPLDNGKLADEIKIYNRSNPYFVPTVVMLSPDKVLFTDLNNRGIAGVIEYDRKEKKLSARYKAKTINEKIELCKTDNNLFVGIFSINDSPVGTTIFKTSPSKPEFDDLAAIYKSQQNDPGNMICDLDNEHIYFIQNLTMQKEKWEAVSLNINDSKVSVLTNINQATQIANMDGRLLLPYRGTIYLLKGKNISSDVLNNK